MKRSTKYAYLLVVLALLLSVFPMSAAAQVIPTNDYFANAKEVSALPFDETVSMSYVSYGQELMEPYPCAYPGRTIWYRYSPATTGQVAVDTAGSSAYWDTFVSVYRANGSGIDTLSSLGCVTGSTSLTFTAEAGDVYYLQVGYSNYSDYLSLHIRAAVPPANDNFADAVEIPGVPFNASADLRYATWQSGEPTGTCSGDTSVGTAWYKFTPSASGSFSARVSDISYGRVAVYTGSTLPSLNQVGCQSWGNLLTFRAVAGTTYYFQVTGMYSNTGTARFSLQTAPPPTADMWFSPGDPSTFDNVTFQNNSSDPANVYGWTCAWDFGDGSGSNECWVGHKFAADGDYTVTLTATTQDGRTCSTTRVVSVKTHDVAITKFTVPQSASAGQTRSLTVGLNSRRYGENVRVDLYKSIPGGLQQVGSLVMNVPVRPANRTTDFSFSYTFTPEDAALGKVTFKAIASIIDARDMLPSDNEAIALPTKISR